MKKNDCAIRHVSAIPMIVNGKVAMLSSVSNKFQEEFVSTVSISVPSDGVHIEPVAGECCLTGLPEPDNSAIEINADLAIKPDVE